MYTNQGLTDPSGYASGTSYSITVAGAPVVVTTTKALAMNPTAVTAVAPAAKTLTATVTGAGAAGTVQFFNGTTSLGTSPVAAGTAALALSNIAAGSYSYHAVFTPTDVAAFTSSTSVGNLAFTVTATPVVTAPVASFTAATTSLTAALTDTSTNAPTSWLWDLGNGTTSTVQSPSVTYAAAGTYTVVLTATNSAGSSTVTKTITVTAPTGTSAAHISGISPVARAALSRSILHGRKGLRRRVGQRRPAGRGLGLAYRHPEVTQNSRSPQFRGGGDRLRRMGQTFWSVPFFVRFERKGH